MSSSKDSAASAVRAPTPAALARNADPAAVYVVSGASRGIGLGLAKEFAGRGWRVIASERSRTTEPPHRPPHEYPWHAISISNTLCGRIRSHLDWWQRQAAKSATKRWKLEALSAGANNYDQVQQLKSALQHQQQVSLASSSSIAPSPNP